MSDANKKKEGSSSSVEIQVEPRVCLHDTPTSITVTQLPSYHPITITLSTHDDEGKRYHTHAHYLTDGSGTVDVERNEAVGGAYTGVFPAGLFTTLKEYPCYDARLQKEDYTTPWLMTLAVHEDHLTLEQSAVSEGLVTILLERYIIAPGVRREPVVHERVRGSIFFPAGPGPYPAVIDIFGAAGGLKEYRASMLASKGFACLAIAYFDYGDLPKVLKTLDLEYFEEAVEYILQQPGVIPDRCGVISSSIGANPGLAMGIFLKKVTAVVSIGGRLIGRTTLTFRGKELWKAADLGMSSYHLDKRNVFTVDESDVKKFYTHDHPCIPPCEKADNDTQFLLIAGDDDLAYSKVDIEALMHRMKLYGRKSYCKSIIYKGAGHIIEPPYNAYAACSKLKLKGREGKVLANWGGSPWGTCKAQEDNWHNMRKFLRMHVQDRSVWFQQHICRTVGKK